MHERAGVTEIDTWTGIDADSMWRTLEQELEEFNILLF